MPDLPKAEIIEVDEEDKYVAVFQHAETGKWHGTLKVNHPTPAECSRYLTRFCDEIGWDDKATAKKEFEKLLGHSEENEGWSRAPAPSLLTDRDPASLRIDEKERIYANIVTPLNDLTALASSGNPEAFRLLVKETVNSVKAIKAISEKNRDLAQRVAGIRYTWPGLYSLTTQIETPYREMCRRVDGLLRLGDDLPIEIKDNSKPDAIAEMAWWIINGLVLRQKAECAFGVPLFAMLINRETLSLAGKFSMENWNDWQPIIDDVIKFVWGKPKHCEEALRKRLGDDWEEFLEDKIDETDRSSASGFPEELFMWMGFVNLTNRRLGTRWIGDKSPKFETLESKSVLERGIPKIEDMAGDDINPGDAWQDFKSRILGRCKSVAPTE